MVLDSIRIFIQQRRISEDVHILKVVSAAACRIETGQALFHGYGGMHYQVFGCASSQHQNAIQR